MAEDFNQYLKEHQDDVLAEETTNAVNGPTFAFPDDLGKENEQTPTEEQTKTEEPTKADDTKAESKADDKPKLTTSDKGTYHGFFLAPINHLQRITDALNEMAKTDEELAKAIAEGKKTFEGCDRYIRNNMADLAREMGKKEITFTDEDVHFIARYYMCNPDNLDVQNVAKAVTNAKTEKKNTKSKAEPKKETKTETKTEKKSAKVMPLTPSMGSLFSDDDFN